MKKVLLFSLAVACASAFCESDGSLFGWTYKTSGWNGTTMNANGGSFTLKIEGSGCEWRAGSSDDWITVTYVNDLTYKVTISANDTSEARSGRIEIVAYKLGSVTYNYQTYINHQICYVDQNGQAKPSVSPATIAFPQAGGTKYVSVTAASGDTWSVSNPVQWLSDSGSGTGNGSVSLTASENTGYEPRSGALTIAGQTVSVTQASSYARIEYENLQGVENPNPAYYKMGEVLTLKPLDDVSVLSFAGWNPEAISADSTGTVSVEAIWKTNNPEVVVASISNDLYKLSISCPSTWSAYYTVDGTQPSQCAHLYSQDDGLVVSQRGGINIKVIGIAPDGGMSEIVSYALPAPNAPTISPSDKTIISSSVSVNVACDDANATIYYTTDGTEPTTASPIYKRFKVSKKTIVKAMAVAEGMAWSKTATAEYALGQCADPTITPADGTVFDESNYQISIAKGDERGTLRYTIDGSNPTETSPVYEGPFSISTTTTVKAKVFDTEYFDSAIVSSTLTRIWAKVATPVIDAKETFTGSQQSVALFCETDDSVIRYTTDGSEPNSHSQKYTEPFVVTNSITVKAIAFKTDCQASDIATLSIVKQWCIGDALNEPDRQFSTDAEAGWVKDVSVSHDGNESMKSGGISDSATTGVYAESKLSTSVVGNGTVRFWWKASCEEDESYEWDHGEFRVDGIVVAKINGASDWQEVVYEIADVGTHALDWVYCKDDFGKDGDDCIWVDEFTWQKSGVVTGLEIAGPTEVLSGETATFSASLVYSGGGREPVSPTWTLVPENGVASIDAQSGVLTAGASAGTVTLNAAVEADGVEWRTNCLVTVTLKPTALSVLGGATKICPNESRTLAFVVTYTDGSTASVSPTKVSVTSGDAKVTADGVLTAGQTAGEIVVSATYEAVGVTVSTTWTVTLVAPTTKETLGTDANLTVSGWHAVAGTSHEGDFSLKADAAAVGETREVSATFSGAGTLSTWLKVSSASRGEIVIDGAVVASLTGDVDWTNVVNVVSSWGTHTVVWRYVKDVEDDAFEDAMWIDSITWTVEKLRVTVLDISGDDNVLVGKTATYGCRATWVDGKEEDVSPVWSIIEGGSCAKIDASTGVLTAVSDGTVTIQAAYTFEGETTTQTKQVKIQKNVKSIAISGEESVYAGTENAYLCVATYTDGSTEEVADVKWSLVSGADSVTLAADGTVTAKAVETDGTATIKAVYTFDGDAFSATKGIAIKATFSVPAVVTGGEAQVLPMAWPNQYPQFATKFGTDPVAAMSKTTGKRDAEGRDLTVWHDYVAGTDPTDVSDVFRAKIEMVDGQPVVSWEPNLNETETLRTYRVYGSPSLGDDAEWTWPPNANTHRFFKVNVSMPDAADETGGTESDTPGVIEPWTAVTPPTIQANLVYNGSSQTGVVSGEGYTLSGNTAANAGTYTATATLESGYKWSDGVMDTARTFVWSIAQAENEWLVEPSLSSTDFKFRSSITVQTGKPRFGTAVANYTTTDLSGLSAGTYSFVSQVSETSNYGALEKTIPFVVRPWDAVLPSAKTGLVYTGQTQTGVFSGNGYTLTGNTAVNAGTYVATATLKTGYKWSDGSTSTTRTITWSIATAQNKWRVEPSLSKTVFYEGDSITVQIGTPLFGTATANYTAAELSKLSAGTYEFVSEISSTGNYTALTKTISFVVRQKSELYSTGKYLVINLSDGSRTSLDDVPTGGWTDEYKTTKLVLRRCSAGADPLGRYTLTQDFYAGVFEVTQKQWQMIMDSDEGWTDSYGIGDTYPAYYVSYNEIRGSSAGAKWPSSSEVDDDSFVGKLRTKTGLTTLDLPTGAQWEYACRAGTKTAYNTGDGASSLALAGWYISNSGNMAHSVGLKQANKWDLYDMHGNVSEWTLDLHGGSLTGNDPVGAATGSYRDIRGGGWSSASLDAESSYSSYFYYPTLEGTGTGFRIFMTVP